MLEPRAGRAICPVCGRAGEAAPLAPLFVVTGASGAGKTAVLPPLARLLRDRCVAFDADLLHNAAGALSGGRPISWPAFRAAWLAVARGVAQSGLPTVLLGPFIPEHLEELPGRRWFADIHFMALDCPDDLRRARLRARPPWQVCDIDGQVEFGQWLRRNIAERVDTSSGPPEDTAAAIAAWVDRHLTRSGAGDGDEEEPCPAT